MLASGAVHCSVFVYLVDPGPFPPKARALVAPVPEPEGVTLACPKLFCSVQLVPSQVSASAIVGEPLYCPPNTIALVLVPATEAPKPYLAAFKSATSVQLDPSQISTSSS